MTLLITGMVLFFGVHSISIVAPRAGAESRVPSRSREAAAATGPAERPGELMGAAAPPARRRDDPRA